VPCGAEEGDRIVRAFLDAWNTGDSARLDALVAPDGVFHWFSAARRQTIFVTYSRTRLLAYAGRRHRAGEQMGLTRLDVAPGGFTYDVVRRARDVRRGAPVHYTGKGALDCGTGEPALIVWSMGETALARPRPVPRAGGTWQSLQRPDRAPRLEPGSDCPRSSGTPGNRLSDGVFGTALALGPGPVYSIIAVERPEPGRFAGNAGVVRYSPQGAGAWRVVKVLWISSPRYGGPALVRGRRIDAPGDVRFGGGARPAGELRLWRVGRNMPGAWRGWPSSERIRGAGCYALQIDGRHFSTVVVFEARPAE
jgi:hypothetical protein